MFKLFSGEERACVVYDCFEKQCITKALEDLQKDICSVGGERLEMKSFLPKDIVGKLVVGSLTNDRFVAFLEENKLDVSKIEGQWENYIIRTVGAQDDTLLIAGTDERGTMWGIYEFSRLFLGVDPLYLWTDYVPEKKTEVVLSKTDIVDGPKSFKFRGWFINDEDLIEGFSKAGVPEKGYDFHKDYASTLEMLVETGLRLKQNLLIPCSHLDVMKPEEEDLIRIVTERGMYISMHHQEPVGVHQWTLDRYYKERGIDDINYFEYKEKYEELWRLYIRKWAKYDNVIWQLGLRGRGDRPVWYNAAGIPTSTQDRGKLISDAIQKQLDIIKEENPGKEILSSSTLWMEGMGLYNENALTFPEGTKVIFADFAPNQMWGEGYYTTPREEDRDYGVYYHVAFWGCGPHLVQGNRPEKIYFNYKDCVAKGDNDYTVLNVANFREMVYNIKCVADITWDIDSFDVSVYREDWCKHQYKVEDASKLAEIYDEYYQCFHEMESDMIPGQMIFMDGMSRRVALKLMEIIRGSELKQVDIQNTRLYDFPDTDSFITYYENGTREAIKRFKKLYQKAIAELGNVAKDRQAFFVNNVVVQIEIILGLYTWVYNLCLAATNRRTKGDDAAYEGYIDESVFALSKIYMDRTKALAGKWEHWYDGDSLINIPADIELTKELHLGSNCEAKEMEILNSRF